MKAFLFPRSLGEIDPEMDDLIKFEACQAEAKAGHGAPFRVVVARRRA